MRLMSIVVENIVDYVMYMWIGYIVIIVVEDMKRIVRENVFESYVF